MLHSSVGAHYLMSEFGERVFPKDKEYLFSKFDYVALGHWHGFGAVKNFSNVYYSGSTERTSGSDKNDKKGFLLVNLDSKLDVKFKEIALRKILHFKIDASSLEEELEGFLSQDFSGAIVELTIYNLDIEKSISIDNSFLEKFFKNALLLKVKRELKDIEGKSYENVESITLKDYFLEHLNKEIKDKEQLDRLTKKAQELFDRVEVLNF